MANFPKKQKDGRWKHDFRVAGRGTPRRRGTFNTKTEALQFEKSEKAKWDLGVISAKDDKRLLSDLADTWYDAHGINLKDGERRKKLLLEFCNRIGNPKAVDFKSSHFIDDRKIKMEAEENPITANTANHYLAYLKALFNELGRLDEWKLGNPLEKVRKIKIDETEMTYLEIDEIKSLLHYFENVSRSEDAALVAKFCLKTGARWSEAIYLSPSQILSNSSIQFSKTKSGKNRIVPIDQFLFDELKEKSKGVGKFQYIFKDCYKAVVRGFEKTGIELPDGQATHVLRHSFASHFVINGGNILTLQKILGHSDIKLTMRYAHLAPDQLQEAVFKNPLWSFGGHEQINAPETNQPVAVTG